jgi:hypothetical protein
VLIDARKDMGAAFNERALPTTLFFDAQCKLRSAHAVADLAESGPGNACNVSSSRPSRLGSLWLDAARN